MVRPVSLAGMSASLLIALGCAETPVEPSAPGHGPLPASALVVTVPDNVAATGVSESQIDVSWRDNSGNETRFEVFRSTSGPYENFSMLAALGANVVRYSDHQLPLVPSLCYKVRAGKTVGSRTTYSSFSGPLCTQAPAPAAPSNAAAAVAPDGSIELTWQDNSSTETNFKIWRASGATQLGSSSMVAITEANVQSYGDAAVVADTRYCYLVVAVRDYAGGGGTSTSTVASLPSGQACATIPPTEPPPSAYDVAARADNSSTVRITVSWTDGATTPPDLRLYRSTDGGGAWNLVPSAGTRWLEFLDAPLPSEQTVCYRVVAYNAAGDAAPSASACAVPPAGPSNLAGSLRNGSIELTWSDHSALEDGYQVWRLARFSSSCSPWYEGEVTELEVYSMVAALPPNATTYGAPVAESDPCDPDAEFWYYVVATKDGGRSDFSNEVSATTGQPRP